MSKAIRLDDAPIGATAGADVWAGNVLRAAILAFLERRSMIARMIDLPPERFDSN